MDQRAMSGHIFKCTEHVIPCQHIRQYPRSTAHDQEVTLHLSVKQYTPINLEPQPGDVTIIGCHASGFPKELYEPFWDDLYQFSRDNSRHAFRIRNIWIADVANQGASGVLNAETIGNEVSYFDHARDLLLMTNHFREQMTRPIIGIGHSMGGTIMVNLALLHPRLLTTIITIEPVINMDPRSMNNFIFAYFLTYKKAHWSSREHAESLFRKNPAYKTWDPRTLELYLAYGLRDVVTTSNSSARSDTSSCPRPVTLTTTPDQEAVSYARASYPPPTEPLHSFKPTRLTHPDLGPNRNPNSAFYRPEANMTFAQLQYLRPSCLFMYGEKSHMVAANAEERAAKRENTGSWGIEKAHVGEEVISGAGHFSVFEKPHAVAQVAGDWIGKELEKWMRTEEEDRRQWQSIEKHKRNRVDDDWRFWMQDQFGEQVKKMKAAKL